MTEQENPNGLLSNLIENTRGFMNKHQAACISGYFGVIASEVAAHASYAYEKGDLPSATMLATISLISLSVGVNLIIYEENQSQSINHEANKQNGEFASQNLEPDEIVPREIWDHPDRRPQLNFTEVKVSQNS